MAKWEIHKDSSLITSSTSSSLTYNFPPNEEYVPNIYNITYTSDTNCTADKTYSIPGKDFTPTCASYAISIVSDISVKENYKNGNVNMDTLDVIILPWYNVSKFVNGINEKDKPSQFYGWSDSDMDEFCEGYKNVLYDGSISSEELLHDLNMFKMGKYDEDLMILSGKPNLLYGGIDKCFVFVKMNSIEGISLPYKPAEGQPSSYTGRWYLVGNGYGDVYDMYYEDEIKSQAISLQNLSCPIYENIDKTSDCGGLRVRPLIEIIDDEDRNNAATSYIIRVSGSVSLINSTCQL